MLTVFTAKYTSKHASGGTLALVLFPVWTHAIDTLQTEIPKYKMKI
jgi:hypothetical protein